MKYISNYLHRIGNIGSFTLKFISLQIFRHHGSIVIYREQDSHPVRSFIPFFSFPHVLCDPTDLIWRKGTPFEAMTGRTAPSLDSLLVEVFLSCKANARRSVHSPQDHFIITLIISDRRDWRDTRGKWHLARNPDRDWWHRHTNLKLFWPQPPWLQGQQGNIVSRNFFVAAAHLVGKEIN